MRLLNIVLREISHRKFNFLLSVAACGIASATFILTLALLESTDMKTEEIIAQKVSETEKEMKLLEDNMRKHMKGLGFNIYIFPEGQEMSEVYDKGYAEKTMPEGYVTKLAESKTVLINHLLPSLTQKISWPEQKRNVVLIGIKGEVPLAHRDPKKPLVDPVEQGKLVLGYELHNSIGLKSGDAVKLMGHDFVVSACHDERGSADDITVWMNLAECQVLLDKKGLINAILALECNCATLDRLAEIRAELAAILPGTKIIEKGSQALARAEARMSAKKTAEKQTEIVRSQRSELKARRENMVSILVPLVGAMSLAVVCLLAFMNARERVMEVGLFLAIGVKSYTVLMMFLAKAFVTGVGGGVLGLGIASLVVSTTGYAFFGDYDTGLLIPRELSIMVMFSMPIFACMASWLPAFWASRHDPAEILRNE